MSLAISGGNLGWFAGGAVAAAVLLRFMKRSGSGIGPGTDPSLLPEPGLDWLRRAHGAKGVWISERARPGEATVWHHAISEKTLSPAHVAVVEQRLAQAVEQGTSGAERLEAGTLLFGSAGGVVAGVLLPAGAPQPSLDLAGEDLLHLLEGAARRPILARIEAESERPIESLGSIALRLAYQYRSLSDFENRWRLWLKDPIHKRRISALKPNQLAGGDGVVDEAGPGSGFKGFSGGWEVKPQMVFPGSQPARRQQ